MVKNDKKRAEKNDFDQQTGCRAPIRWSKYTTLIAFATSFATSLLALLRGGQ